LTEITHILIAEDEALSAMYLEMALKKIGYYITIVATGEEAIRAFMQKNIDILMLDIHLAGEMDGIEAAQKIRDINEVPIIFMSGYEVEIMGKRFENIDYSAFLVKPIDISDLTEILKKVIS